MKKTSLKVAWRSSILVAFALLLGTVSSVRVLAVTPVDGGVQQGNPTDGDGGLTPAGGGSSSTSDSSSSSSGNSGSSSSGGSFDESFFAGNDILFYNPTCSNVATGSDSTLVTGDNVKKAFFYFTGKGLTAAQAAGIVGNLIQESGVNPKSVQKGGPGRGIAQWSAGGRWDSGKNSLKSWAGSKDPLDLLTQLDFMWYEMTKVPGWKLSLEGSKDPRYPSLRDIKGDSQADAIKAGHSFGYLYERFGISGSRDKYAGDVWTKYHSQVTTNAALGNDPGSDGCNATETGMCENAPAGWVQVTNKVVQIACAEWNKKVVEDGAYNCDKAGNITKYVKAAHGGSCGESWCGDFVSYVYKTAGFPFPKGVNAAFVPSLYSYIRSAGAFKGVTTDPKPGSVVTYNGQEHTGLVVGVQGKYVTTIEGNTGPDPGDKVNTSRLEGVHMHHRTHPSPGFSQDGWGDFDTLSKKQAK